MEILPARPIVLIIRDGWGTNPHPQWNHANAVHLARKPVDDRLMATYPHGLIRTCGMDVGLPEGVMGNSEVGHQNIGAGRIVEQEVMRITGRIRDGSFFRNPILLGAIDHVRKTGGRIHFMGLCSDGRVHSDLKHLFGLLELTKRERLPGERVFVHAFTDGRDTSPNRGLEYIRTIEAKCQEFGTNPVATVVGRYYPMDRDNRWDRVQAAYRLLTGGLGKRFPSAETAVKAFYQAPMSPKMSGDEFIEPSVMVHGERPIGIIQDGDAVVFFNFRGDRPRQLTKAFVLDEFPFHGKDKDGSIKPMGFDRGPRVDVHFVTMTAYEEGLPVRVVFEKPPKMENILGDYLSRMGLKQFRCAETEKYPHVTFFFNDYRDEPFVGEQRRIIPSPREVKTYDEKPEMSASEVTTAVIERVGEGNDDFLVVNYANPDMIGHTGNLPAAIRAVEVVDECVGRVVNAVLRQGGGLIVTADHGNCEQMVDPATGAPHTAHTTYDVELIVVDERFRGRKLRSGGRLADIAPTVLEMLGVPKPDTMTGDSLLS
ncbi:MAG: 2,3-bisphosphoglycerate-independent phosphoglycerate mutase [Planctomycetota bacterium]